MAPTNPIQHSFELATERREDLTPLVYRRLFREHPEAEAMFRNEGRDLVKGSMLALAVEAMLDFAGGRTGQFRMIECEVASHEAYGTPRKLFGEFFGVIADTLRDILGPATGRRRSSRRGVSCWARSTTSSLKSTSELRPAQNLERKPADPADVRLRQPPVA